MGQLVLLLASPRVAPGLLSRDAWSALEQAGSRRARDPQEPLALAIGDDLDLTYAAGPDGEPPHPPELARELVAAAGDGTVVWVGSADGDPGLSDAIASEVSRLPEPPDVEVLVGSWDVQGARLLDAVAVMDRLRSPGGCPWDAEQTHESLVKYLIEEAHEAAEAVGSGDRTHMVEELGDLLLQVLFQARVGQDDEDGPFDIDDVAGGLVEKLVRRHPHVFADGDAASTEDVERNWERIKSEEKAVRASSTEPTDGGGDAHADLLDGIPASLSPLLAADKVLARLGRRGADVDLTGGDLGTRMLALVAEARAEGGDADTLLRAALRDVADRP